jgi:hypothetical protein
MSYSSLQSALFWALLASLNGGWAYKGVSFAHVPLIIAEYLVLSSARISQWWVGLQGCISLTRSTHHCRVHCSGLCSYLSMAGGLIRVYHFTRSTHHYRAHCLSFACISECRVGLHGVSIWHDECIIFICLIHYCRVHGFELGLYLSMVGGQASVTRASRNRGSCILIFLMSWRCSALQF